VSASKEPEEAKALIEFLASPAAAAVIIKSGGTGQLVNALTRHNGNIEPISFPRRNDWPEARGQ
jgi:ABC-type Fe3+ transport system substrate-binding protein